MHLFILAVLLFLIFGGLGIIIFSRFKNAKKYINKKNSIIFCIAYVIYTMFITDMFVADTMKMFITNMFGDESWTFMFVALLFMIYSYLSAILTMAIKNNFKKIFNDEFYFAFLGTLILSALLTLYV